MLQYGNLWAVMPIVFKEIMDHFDVTMTAKIYTQLCIDGFG